MRIIKYILFTALFPLWLSSNVNASSVQITASNGSPNNIDLVDPTTAFFSGQIDGGTFVASADISSGRLRAQAIADGSGPFGINTHTASGDINLLSIFNNSGGDIIFPTGSISITVTSTHTSSPGSGGGFIGQVTTGGITVVGLGTAGVRHEVIHEVDVGGAIIDTMINTVPSELTSGTVTNLIATSTGLSFTGQFLGELILPNNGRLDLGAFLSVSASAGGLANTIIDTDAASSAILSIVLPEGISPSDLSNDAGVELTWVQPIPIPMAFWLLASGLIGLFSISRRKQTIS